MIPSPGELVRQIMGSEDDSTLLEEPQEEYNYPDHHGEDQDDAWWVPEPRGPCRQWTTKGTCERGHRCPYTHHAMTPAMAMCSVHRKVRSLWYMIGDGAGGACCIESDQCKDTELTGEFSTDTGSSRDMQWAFDWAH